jgi:precorrin-6Y C5,15-methyltransferase (decarboxylating)
MSDPVHVIGIGADGPAGLKPVLRERIEGADFLAGGARHLAHFPEARGERFVITSNLAELVVELRRRQPRQACVVLASGDPMFFGIGKYLSEHLGATALCVEPARSSMQLVFARAGLSWQEAVLASVHGRDRRRTLLPLLGQRLIGLFTDEDNSPAAVARFFLERGPGDYQAFVGENLEAPEERVTGWLPLADLAKQRFAPLNYLILRRQQHPNDLHEVQRRRSLVPGVPDEEFLHPSHGPAVMTRQEVRAAVLAKLGRYYQPGDVVWDLGTGLGTVAVELAVLRPQIEIVAVERDRDRAAFARCHRERFGAYNVRVIEGAMPEALLAENEKPQAVFIGGSGGRLAGILDVAADRLHEGGVLVAAFVTLEHLALAVPALRQRGWPVDVAEIHVARADSLAGLTGLRPLRGVFLVRAQKPAGASSGG